MINTQTIKKIERLHSKLKLESKDQSVSDVMIYAGFKKGTKGPSAGVSPGHVDYETKDGAQITFYNEADDEKGVNLKDWDGSFASVPKQFKDIINSINRDFPKAKIDKY